MKKEQILTKNVFRMTTQLLAAVLMLFLFSCGTDDTKPEEIAEEVVVEVEDEEETDDTTEEETDDTTEEETDDTTEEETGNLDPNVSPAVNFDLSTWNISIPIDEDNNDKADTIKEVPLNAGYENETYFYTAADGGMVFKCPIVGPKTSINTSYTRTELREMLRAGNTDIDTQGITKNNWVFGSAPQDDITNSGGYDGELKATLAVNHVTTTGDDGQVGRVIVGQIHANDDEPIRLYYRKLPGNELGSIYMAHEENAANETYYDMIGSRSSSASNPADGVALDEKFSYVIKVVGNDMWVTISREGKEDVEQYVDMKDSGYDVGGQYMYFKAGVYNQNNTGTGTDYVQATFYSLSNTHSN